MTTAYTPFTWAGQTTATAQANPGTGFTQGKAYQVKGAAVDNNTGIISVLILNDSNQPTAVNLPANFTFQ